MTVETRPRRIYSEEEIAEALTAVKMNEGYVKPVAEQLGIPRMTLAQWVSGERRPETAENRAQRLEVSHINVQETIRTLNTVIPRALERVLEALPSMSGYHAMLTAAIGIDKRQLLSGGATSRTEVLRARYVEPQALRELASTVIDVPQRRRGVREVAGPSHLPSAQKRVAKRPRAKKRLAQPEDLTPGTP